jgi:uncharacterized protein
MDPMNRLIRFAVDHPYWTIFACIVLAVAFALPMRSLTRETDTEQFVASDDPVRALLDEAKDRYGETKGIRVILLNEDGVFNDTTLTIIEQMTAGIEAIPGIESVTTLLNSQTIVGTETAISVHKTAPDGLAPQNAEDMETLQARLTDDANLMGSVVSEDGRAALLDLKLQVDADDFAITQAVMEIVDANRDDGDTIHVSGKAYFNSIMADEMSSDILLLVPLAILVMVVLLFVSFISIRGILVPIIIVLLSVVVAMGTMSLLGFPITTVSNIAPILLLAIGIADAIHVLNQYNEEISKGLKKRAAILNTMQEMKGPVVMTSLTTAAGFLSLISAFLIPQRQFGMVTAIGVMAAMLFSLVLIPAILSILKAPRVRNTEAGARPLTRVLVAFERMVIGHRKLVIVISLAVFVLMLAGLPRLKIETSNTEFLGKDHEAVQVTEISSEYFSGDMSIRVEVDTGRRDGLADPVVLNAMLELEQFMLENGVNKTYSMTTLVRQMNEKFNGNDTDFYAIPENGNMISQLLLLYTFQGGTMGSLALGDFSAGTISGMYNQGSSANVSRMATLVQSYIDEHCPENGDLRVRMVGQTALTSRMVSQMTNSQFIGLATTTAAVAILVMLLMGSFIAGLLAIIPLLVTVAVSMGLMAYTGQPLDMMTLMVSVIAVGIGIDYSIHFISRFRTEYQLDEDASRALQTTVQTTGRAITYNALTVALGFLVVMFASFKGVRMFGWQIALTMVVSALSALTIIPAILVQWTPKFLSRTPWKRS